MTLLMHILPVKSAINGTFDRDLINFITTKNFLIKVSGVMSWKLEAICHRPYLQEIAVFWIRSLVNWSLLCLKTETETFTWGGDWICNTDVLVIRLLLVILTVRYVVRSILRTNRAIMLQYVHLENIELNCMTILHILYWFIAWCY